MDSTRAVIGAAAHVPIMSTLRPVTVSQSSAFERLSTRFQAAASQRNLREDFDVATGELGWVTFEREEMCAEVNAIRSENGLDAVDDDRIRVVELTSSGHSDYALKFALRCAEITQA